MLTSNGGLIALHIEIEFGHLTTRWSFSGWLIAAGELSRYARLQNSKRGDKKHEYST